MVTEQNQPDRFTVWHSVVMRRLGVVAVLSVLLWGGGVSAAAAAAPAGTAGTVSRVVDGDTVHVTDGRGSRIKVRVLGIDTPETVDRRKPVQCWGPEATRFATTTLLHKKVTLFTDPTQATRDRYDRLLAYVYLPDGSNYSLLAARAGAARSYVFNHKPVAQHAAITTAEAQARLAHRGLWGACPA
jgi:micrococcal nuclease